MEKILIDNPKEYEATTGEVLELHYRILSLPGIGKWQKNLIIKKISESKNFRATDIKFSNGVLVITVKIIDNPIPLLALVIGISAVLSTFFIMNSLGKVYKIVDKPAGAIIATSAIIGITVGLFILLRR